MGAMIARPWRALRTGMAFASFGALALWLVVTSVPWLRWTVADENERQLRVQAVVNRTYRRFIRLMQGLGLMHFHAIGLERLQEPGVLVVANHPTLIDAVAILSKMPHSDCITKQANTRNPFLRGVIRAAGYIPNAGGQAIVDTCATRLRHGRSLVLFPEGTRSPLGELGPFQRGAAHIALSSGRPLLPVIVTCEPQTLMRGQKWYEVPDRPFEYTVRVGDPISVRPYLEAIEAGLSRGLAARRLTAELRETFEKALRGAAGSRAA
jgi:1-acyl-sn-glycerol-3-phosphate acyltransferase